MPRIVETTVFKFEELSERAKEKAREWWREEGMHDSWWEYTYEDADTCAKLIGIEIARKDVPLMSGKTRQDPSIWFQLSYSQGDGAAFDGRYAYVKGAAKAIRSHAPKDETLHRIADELQGIQSKHRYKLEARIASHRDTSVDVEVFDAEGNYADVEPEKAVREALSRFARWIYDQLRAESDWQMADEQVDESIEANEYEFLEDGSRA